MNDVLEYLLFFIAIFIAPFVLYMAIIFYFEILFWAYEAFLYKIVRPIRVYLDSKIRDDHE